MPSVTNQGGSITADNNHSNFAGVITATAAQTNAGATATWVVTLRSEPAAANFTAGQAVTYNAKGTNNTNADNALVVISVNGPAKYTCNGPWPMRT